MTVSSNASEVIIEVEMSPELEQLAQRAASDTGQTLNAWILDSIKSDLQPPHMPDA